MKLRERILQLLKEHPEGLRQIDIARTLNASRSRVSEIIRELEAKGIVEKIREGSIVKITLSKPIKPRETTPSKTLKIGIIWSSEYPFITPFAKKLRDKLGYSLEVRVYSNGLDATWDLVIGEIDLALTPMITQLLYASLTSKLKIIGGGATGGASIIRNPRGREGWGASTKASTMDLCLTRAWKLMGVEEEHREYAMSGEELMRKLVKGEVELIAIWEPLASKLKNMGYREITSCRELEVNHCCTLAANTRIEEGLLEKIGSIYAEALREFMRNPYRWLEWYSAKTSISVDVLKHDIQYYEYKDYVEVEKSIKLINDTGLKIPNPNILREIVLSQD